LTSLVRGVGVSLLVLGLYACSSSSTPGASGASGAGGAAGSELGAGGLVSGGAGASSGTSAAGTDSGGGAALAGAPAGGASGSAGAAGNAAAAGSAGSAGAGPATGGAGSRDLSTDRSLFLGASRCAQANLQLCEDFESGTLDSTTWTTLGGKPVVDELQKARGMKALHLTISGGGQSAIRESKTFPATNNSYYGRAFVYFGSLPTPSGLSYSHWTMIAATGTQVGGEIRVGGQMQGGVNLWGVGTDSSGSANGTGDWTNSDKDPNGKPMAVPTGQWLCIEWLHKGDTNETRFWWDGVEHPSLYTKPSTPHGGNSGVQYILPQFKQVWLGWQEYQATSEKFELWLDEIAIDKDRIGCVI
jgi:hypothetical protein